MPWVILAVALCVLVWFWPRNTLIGLAVVGTAGVLAGIAFWGYGVYDERQRELVAITVEPAAEAASRTSPGIACGEGELLVSITNGSGKTVTGVRFNVGAYREGRSTNIAKGNWFDDDHIINPRGTVSACWKAPGLTRDPEGTGWSGRPASSSWSSPRRTRAGADAPARFVWAGLGRQAQKRPGRPGHRGYFAIVGAGALSRSFCRSSLKGSCLWCFRYWRWAFSRSFT